jgi:hypothetical protein
LWLVHLNNDTIKVTLDKLELSIHYLRASFKRHFDAEDRHFLVLTKEKKKKEKYQLQ